MPYVTRDLQPQRNVNQKLHDNGILSKSKSVSHYNVMWMSLYKSMMLVYRHNIVFFPINYIQAFLFQMTYSLFSLRKT